MPAQSSVQGQRLKYYNSVELQSTFSQLMSVPYLQSFIIVHVHDKVILGTVLSRGR